MAVGMRIFFPVSHLSIKTYTTIKTKFLTDFYLRKALIAWKQGLHKQKL